MNTQTYICTERESEVIVATVMMTAGTQFMADCWTRRVFLLNQQNWQTKTEKNNNHDDARYTIRLFPESSRTKSK
jgi:hypothetical protein